MGRGPCIEASMQLGCILLWKLFERASCKGKRAFLEHAYKLLIANRQLDCKALGGAGNIVHLSPIGPIMLVHGALDQRGKFLLSNHVNVGKKRTCIRCRAPWATHWPEDYCNTAPARSIFELTLRSPWTAASPTFTPISQHLQAWCKVNSTNYCSARRREFSCAIWRWLLQTRCSMCKRGGRYPGYK